MADNKDKKAPNQNQINIELPEEVAEGVYSNLAMIAHSNSEFVIDFIRLIKRIQEKEKERGLVLRLPKNWLS